MRSISLDPLVETMKLMPVDLQDNLPWHEESSVHMVDDGGVTVTLG